MLSLLVIVVGIVSSLTVIGLVIGGSGGPVFALLLGIASGLVYYEHRVRKLPRR